MCKQKKITKNNNNNKDSVLKKKNENKFIYVYLKVVH